jgi:hypothetical protein
MGMKTNDSQPMVSQDLPYVVSGPHKEWIIKAVNALAGIDDPAALRAALEELRDARQSYPHQLTGYPDIEYSVDKLLALLPPETP